MSDLAIQLLHDALILEGKELFPQTSHNLRRASAEIERLNEDMKRLRSLDWVLEVERLNKENNELRSDLDRQVAKAATAYDAIRALKEQK